MTTTVPTGNTYLKLTVNDNVDNIHGDMVFQLFNDLAPNTVAKITQLANGLFYNGLTFHRIINSPMLFMIQGGDPNGNGTGGPGFKFDDEINQLQFTSSGILAMANSGPDTNGSQFFITADSTRWLDFRYTIFGFLVQGDAIRNAIQNVPTNPATDGPEYRHDHQRRDHHRQSRRRAAALGRQGHDGRGRRDGYGHRLVTGEFATQTFHVTVAADTNNDPPFLMSISPIQVTQGASTTATIPATDVEGDAIYYSGTRRRART